MCRHSHYNECYYCPRVHNPYGFWNFMLDVFMTFFTAGLWLIWIAIRSFRNR